LNGIDRNVWNPATDEMLPSKYDARDLAGKKLCREALLARHGFDSDFKGPVFGMVCRLTTQKGVDLVLANREFFKREEVRLIVLGSGDARLQEGLRELAASLTRKVALCTRNDECMSHLIEAGSDFFLMPSRFEPCGLNQMYSQVYGTIPIVTNVGGLVDTVKDLAGNPLNGTGIVISPTAEGVLAGLRRAQALYGDKTRYRSAQLRAMQTEFGWDKAVAGYEALYD